MPWLDLQSEIESEFDELRLDSEYKVQAFLYGRSINQLAERSAKKKEHYAWCKAAGICFDCGKRITPGKYPRCEEHLRRLLDQIRNKKKKIAADGLCIDCGEKREPERANGVTCLACNDYRNKRWRMRHPPKERPATGNCTECDNEVPRGRFSTKLNQVSKTCSKRCTQIARRKQLISLGICIRCKKASAVCGLQLCSGCGAKHNNLSHKKKKNTGYTIKCGEQSCHNHVAIGLRAGMQPGFCCRTCANREMDRRRRDRKKSAQVVVTSSDSEHPDVAQSVTMLIGKRGHVVASYADRVVVRFHGGNIHTLRPSEVCVLS